MKKFGYNQKIFSGFLIFGLMMGIVFPIYASMFVQINEGSSLFFIVGCLLAGLFVGIMNYFIYRIFIGKIISLLSVRFHEIAKGNLTGPNIEIEDGDDFGRLASSFNTMKHTLQNLILRITTLSNYAANASSQIATNATETKASVDIISKSIDEIAEGTSIQSTYSASILDKTMKMAQEMEIGATISKQTEQVANKATNVADTGKQAISEAITHLHFLKDSVIESTKRVQSLGKRSDEIGNIITIITSLAERTNLLALNAAIEAARAGDHGKGFTVVASEVRKLAEQSRNSSIQISELIRSIQAEINETVGVMEGNLDIVHKQVEIIQQSNKAFEKIVDHVQETEDCVDHLKQVFTDLETTSKQFLEAIEHITTIINDTASAARNVSSSVKKQKKIFVELTESSDEVSRFSNKLQTEVHKFNV